MRKTSSIGNIFTTLVYILLYAPLLVMVFFSFNESKSTSVFSGFSLRWYRELFSSSDTVTAVKNTLILAVASAVIATVLGTAAAVGIWKIKNRSARSAVMTVTNIPMMNPEIVTGVSMMLLFVFVGRMIGAAQSLSFWTLLIAHITFNLPYVILNVLPKLRQTDKYLSEAAMDLGSTPARAFFNVVLPQAYPGIMSGFIMAFTLSLDDFVISYYTNGADFQTLPLKIFAMTKKTVKPDMYALSTLIFVVVLLLLVMSNLISAKDDNGKQKARKKKSSPVPRRVGIAVCALILASLVPLGMYFGSGGTDAQIHVEGNYYIDSSTGLSEYAGTTINVFNWGEYISDGSDGTVDVNAEFERITGIKVNYQNFDSNESMYGKLKSGAVSYDIIIPSDYMIERLKNEGMLRPLDFSMIDNYDYVDEKYKGLYFDENNEYSVPYNVGMVGLIYNTKLVEGTPDSWSIMWDERYEDNILTFNNPRDAFAIAQILLGIDLNTSDSAQWRAAADKLIEQNDVLQGRVMDEIFNKMQQGNAAIAPYYAGDFLTMQEINPDLAFVYPKEGTNIFVDSVCVPKSCQNYEAAMLYINFLLEPEVALANAEYICYASPNTAVVNDQNYSLAGNEILYPADEDMPKVQYYHDMDEETRKLYNDLWEEVVRSGS
ncbi:MAG: extracellular solute-binding protein [Clostridia bacterium]|nr:extracellular solute-binding protein [Clostridia bacterium]